MHSFSGGLPLLGSARMRKAAAAVNSVACASVPDCARSAQRRYDTTVRLAPASALRGGRRGVGAPQLAARWAAR
eukprot:886352-Prymnesium_polylepis.1